MSNIRVSVEWQNNAVFAGENVECVITFKNIASSSPISTRDSNTSGNSWGDSHASRKAHSLSIHSPRQSFDGNLSNGHHRAASVNRFDYRTATPQTASTHTIRELEQPSVIKRHRRSISGFAQGGSPSLAEKRAHDIPASRRRGRGHGRTASLQIFPGRSPASLKSPSFGAGPPLPSATTRLNTGSGSDHASAVPGLSRSSTSPRLGIVPLNCEPQIRSEEPAFGSAVTESDRSKKLGYSASSLNGYQNLNSPIEVVKSAGNRFSGEFSGSWDSSLHPLQDSFGPFLDTRSFLTKIFSSSSNADTTRRSTDLYSTSNNSRETTVSEYLDSEIGHTPPFTDSAQKRSNPPSSKFRRTPEILIVGYGNVVGNFNSDASLVNSSVFDDIKRKAVIGNQGGGGVVRVGSITRQNGLLGSLGWNALGGSLGGLLGAKEMSSIKEATSDNDSKWFPVLSTPQSLLFTDLRLEPGESESYSFSYNIPSGLPPTYKGKALRISYNIVIGVQRANQATRHIVRPIEFPFRVLPSVDDHGHPASYDLMSPHVMLHNEPLIASLSNPMGEASTIRTKPALPRETHAEQDFRAYVNQLLDMPHQNSPNGPLSPSSTDAKSLQESVATPVTTGTMVALAIQRSNWPLPSKLSANRFEITRSGNPAAVIMLARPAYRLGEVIPIAIDFYGSAVRCYTVRLTLETSEHVNSAIALRSEASILRLSRRIYAIQHATCMSTERAIFNLAIPSSSTPDFVTSGVSLQWHLRVEFFTSVHGDNELDADTLDHDLLEKVAEDERGSVFAAIQAIPCENFDVQLPLKIYGDKGCLEDSHRVQDSSI